MTRDKRWLLEEKYAGVETSAFKADCDRLASGEPVAYVIGYQPFLGLTIYLDSRPLIPRPETEWWVEKLLKELGVVKPLRFLDLCAGSGAIGCAVLKHTDAKVYFGEIDPAHQATVLKNIRENGLDESRAVVRIGDLFEPFSHMKFDVIAVNPPYVPATRELPASVADFEPPTALRAGPDGLAVIRRIAAALPAHLAPGAEAWIEIDSAHAEAARELFAAQGLNAELCTDAYDRPRFLVVS